MAIRKLAVQDNGSYATWSFVEYDRDGEPVRGDVALQMSTGELHPDLVQAVLRYGMKQIIADAGAMSKGASLDDRLAAMERRAAALKDGTYGLRAASVAKMPDAAVWDAVTGLGLIEDKAENRQKWKDLGAKQRKAMLMRPDVVAYIAQHASDNAQGDDVLAAFS